MKNTSRIEFMKMEMIIQRLNFDIKYNITKSCAYFLNACKL